MRVYYLLALIILLMACKREAALTPSPATPMYTLPQGNHGYDDTIMTCYKKYGAYILYRFTQDDYSYNYSDRKSDSAFVANPVYISAALQFFKTQLLDVYPESFIQQTIPYKILLASYIGSGATRSAKGFASTNSALAIGWADSTLVQKLQSPAAVKQVRSWLHRYYIERAYRAKIIQVPEAFAALAPSLYGAISPETQYEKGVLGTPGSDLNLVVDFLAYVEAITGNSQAQLEAGLFSRKVDKKGLIRQKYNTVINYFNVTYGVNLQAIGDMP
ncbi:hypothetical protein [Chitinophaga nivalis]|uniref:Uncharacterized protein n=1 Tax=Chitinophaga nivalis TaxID=2991709 RepID=A0ABT3IH32_9BACT|nr:hypothetical protein [Chitinophaga nivalis]MCW3467031.1 hypothetical protein [Chitinophaga nivalis]MCW3483278.1 hypothetical protein [Chitinophaga nivalis]